MKRKNETILITGGAVRLGRYICEDLAANGYNIAIHYNQSEEAAITLKNEIISRNVDCDIFPLNFASNPDFDLFLADVKNKFLNIKCLINCASVYAHADIKHTNAEMFENNYRVNFFAPFYLSQAFHKLNIEGSIINILDNKVFFNQYDYCAYLLSKKSLAEFTKMAALEFAPNLRVNGIAPGVILPGETRTKKYVDWRVQGIPLKRKGEPEHICSAVRFLIENEFITGQILAIDGGESIDKVGLNFSSYEKENFE